MVLLLSAGQKLPNQLVPIVILASLSVVFWFPCLGADKVPVAAQYQSCMQPWRSDQPPTSSRQWDSLLWDSVAQFYPWRLLSHRALRSNQLPLWSPYQYCGYPVVGNGQSSIFYPPNWLLRFLHPIRFLGISLALHFFLAGLMTFYLCRLLRLGVLPSLFAAVAFSYGGFMVTWAELPSLVNTLTWLPGALLGIELVMRGRTRPGMALAAACLGLALLAGHMQIAAYVWLVAAVYSLSRIVYRLLQRHPVPVWPLAGAMALGLAIGMVQLLPIIELGNLSPRGSQRPTPSGWEFHQVRALQPVELITFALPNFLGTPARGDYPGISYSEHCGFAGITTLVLALVAIVGRRCRWSWGLAIAAAIVLSIVMGAAPAKLLYFTVPKLGLTGSFTRLLGVYILCMAMLAGLGLHYLLGKITGPQGSRTVWATIIGIVLIGVLLVELWPWGREFLPLSPAEQVYPPAAVTSQLRQRSDGKYRVLAITPKANWSLFRTPQALLPPNSATVYEYHSVQGYDSLSVANFFNFARQLEGQEPAPVENGNMMLIENYRSGRLSEAAVKWIVADEPLEGKELQLKWQGQQIHLYERPALPRARLAGASAARGEQPGLVDESLNSLRISVQSPRPDTLILADTYYPGWRAFTDGQPTEISMYHDVFRQITVPEGSHHVLMAYYPASVVCGLFISLVAALLLAAMLVSRQRKAGRGPVSR